MKRPEKYAPISYRTDHHGPADSADFSLIGTALGGDVKTAVHACPVGAVALQCGPRVGKILMQNGCMQSLSVHLAL